MMMMYVYHMIWFVRSESQSYPLSEDGCHAQQELRNTFVPSGSWDSYHLRRNDRTIICQKSFLVRKKRGETVSRNVKAMGGQMVLELFICWSSAHSSYRFRNVVFSLLKSLRVLDLRYNHLCMTRRALVSCFFKRHATHVWRQGSKDQRGSDQQTNIMNTARSSAWRITYTCMYIHILYYGVHISDRELSCVYHYLYYTFWTWTLGRARSSLCT